MAAVDDILTIVKDQALVGAGDATDDARVLRYLNLVYKQVYRETAESYPQLLLSSQSITQASGSGTVSSHYKIVSVKETTGNTFLDPYTLPELEVEEPSLDATGTPNRYYLDGLTTIKTYPIDNSTILVRYVPSPSDLASGGAESTIKIPPAFHDLLIWGTLYYMAYDERDKSVGAEIGISQAKYDMALNSYRRWLLMSQTRKPLRTEVLP